MFIGARRFALSMATTRESADSSRAAFNSLETPGLAKRQTHEPCRNVRFQGEEAVRSAVRDSFRG